MGLEVYRNNPHLPSELTSFQNTERLRSNRNLINVFAEKLIADSTYDLVALDGDNSSMIHATTTLELPPINDSVGTHKARKQAGAQILFGTTLEIIEDMIATGEFDIYTYTNRYDLAVGNAGMNKFNVNRVKNPPVRLTDSAYKILVAAAEQDKTFSIFFKEPQLLLPKRVYQILQGGGALDIIKGFLPDYEEVAKNLIVDKPLTEAERTKHKLTLNYFDDLLKKIDDLQTRERKLTRGTAQLLLPVGKVK